MHEFEVRTYDGRNNNIAHPDWGRAGQQLRRLVPASYYGGKGQLGGRDRPNPRVISNEICAQGQRKILSARKLSDFVWAWGQFLDHEMDLSLEADNPKEPHAIDIPDNDPEKGFGGGTIPFLRSRYDPTAGTDILNPRQQINVLSAYIDGANVYGANAARAAALRTFDGSGRLRVNADSGSDGDLLPYNDAGLPNASPPGIEPRTFFLAGDRRANEHAVLTSMHTLFVREHNRLCGKIAVEYPYLKGNDTTIYERVRRYVGALMQVVTYEEFLPALLGPNALSPYAGYNEHVDAGISNLFATACYRLGHSMLSPQIQLGVKHGTKRLRDLFFSPASVKNLGIEPFLSGLATQVMQEIDVHIIDEVRSFLFHQTDRVPKEKRLLSVFDRRHRLHLYRTFSRKKEVCHV